MATCLHVRRSQVFSGLIPMLNTVAEPCKPGWYQSSSVQKKTRATVSWFGGGCRDFTLGMMWCEIVALHNLTNIVN